MIKKYSDKETPKQRAMVIAELRKAIDWLETPDGQYLMGPDQLWSGGAVLSYMVNEIMIIAKEKNLSSVLMPIWAGVMRHICSEYGTVGDGLRLFPGVVDDLKRHMGAEFDRKSKR